MTYTPDVFSLLPPVAAIVLALLTRQVLLSLAVGTLAGILVYTHFDPAAAVIEIGALFAGLFTTPWILKTLGFAVLVGSVMELVRRSGGIDGFVHLLQERYKMLRSRRGALLLVYVTGLVIFIESSITSLIAGAIGRPLAGRFGFSREKLAYVCDSTAAPVCSLLVINGWGALLLGLITTQIAAGYLYGDAVNILVHSVVFNFYAMIALVLTFSVIWFEWDIGPMRRCSAEHGPYEQEGRHGDASLMIVPLLLMVAGVFLFLWISGGGDLLKGSGSSAVFYTMLLTLGGIALQYRLKQAISWQEYWDAAVSGARALIPIAAILLFAFAIGKVIDLVGTGSYLAGFLEEGMAHAWLPAAVFVLASIMAFATGTSWGTFSVMLPIAVVMGAAGESYMPLLIGAVISGGVFGDHCSPISDTTIISSLAAGCDHIDHVRTQLPYALLAGGAALLMFLAVGYGIEGI
ncbi:Na+/H+ antiporter NhaC family protein [Sulfurimonas diazotrophicus]|uniref:Na+/H+ antiporter NhaC family protein n=1 Tax=Sulfurimonas diazotrophicus TaxID=3131939 RepID=A0ABZ3HAW1_9BACT